MKEQSQNENMLFITAILGMITFCVCISIAIIHLGKLTDEKQQAMIATEVEKAIISHEAAKAVEYFTDHSEIKDDQ